MPALFAISLCVCLLVQPPSAPRAPSAVRRVHEQHAAASASAPRRGTSRGTQSVVRTLGDGTIESVDSVDIECEFLTCADGSQCAQIIDELESTCVVPETPEDLADELLGYWAIRYTGGEGGAALANTGLSGYGRRGEGASVVGHFLRFASPEAKEPAMQAVEVIVDENGAGAGGRLVTLKGDFEPIDGGMIAGAARSGGDGMLSRMFGTRSKGSPGGFSPVPALREQYDSTVVGGEFVVGAPSVRRQWACTFLGAQLLVCRLGGVTRTGGDEANKSRRSSRAQERAGGIAVYERRTETEVQSEIGALLDGPTAMTAEMADAMRAMLLGAAGGPGGGAGGDERWRRAMEGGPSQRSSIP